MAICNLFTTTIGLSRSWRLNRNQWDEGTMAIQQAVAPWMRGYDFGIGVDLMTGSPLAQAVIDNHSAVNGAEGSIVSFEVQRIRTTAELEDSLGISADASFGSSLFGAGATVRFNFAKRSKIQTSTLFMAVKALVQLKFFSIDAPVLTPAAARLVDNPNVFDQRFGNMFVRGLSRGGLFLGVLRVEAERAEDAESISGELKGSYGLFSAEAKTKFENIQNRFKASSFVSMYHEGGPTNLKIDDPTNPVELLRNVNLFLDAFQKTPEQVAIPYEVTLAPIIIAEGPLPPNAADMEKAQDILVFCAKRRSALLDQLNQLQYIVDKPSRFDFTNSASIETVRNASVDTQIDLDLIAECASTAINHPGMAKFPADFARGKTPSQDFPSAKMPNPMPQPKVSQRGIWTPKADMPIRRDSFGLAAAGNGKIYAIGGSRGPVGPDLGGPLTLVKEVEEYDPATNRWATRADMPTPRKSLAVAVAGNGKIYTFGGGGGAGRRETEEYDPTTNAWTTRRPMPTARSQLAAAAANNGKIYVVGGSGGRTRNEMEEYDPVADVWTSKRPLPTARHGLGLVAARNGKLYAIGGVGAVPQNTANFGIGFLPTVEEYDPTTDSWTPKANMPTPRGHFGVAAASNGKIYVVGGEGGEGTNFAAVANVEEYDPLINSWAPREPMTSARMHVGLAAASNGNLYVAGGFVDILHPVPTVEEYMP
jgi:N-acetylneuraminic acid mutarotase